MLFTGVALILLCLSFDADVILTGKRTLMSKFQEVGFHRKYVISCTVNGRLSEAIEDIGVKLTIAELDEGLAAKGPSFATRDRFFRDILGTARAEINNDGHTDPFFSLQLDLTTNANVDYITETLGSAHQVCVCVFRLLVC